METKTTRAKARRLLAGALAVSGALGLLSFSGPVQEGVGDTVEMARATLERWVETRRIISQEKRDWRVGRELLQERIDLVQREIDSLRERLADAEKSIDEADEKRAGLVEQNDSLEVASNALADTVQTIETEAQALAKRLPDPIVERVKAFLQRIPEDPSQSKASLSERFQNVVGVLDQTNRFHREVTVVPELRQLDGGTSAEVTTFYLGLGKAFYASNDGTAAGIGTASPAGGWTWQSRNDSAAAIAQAIAILNGGEVAEFVRVPVRVD